MFFRLIIVLLISADSEWHAQCHADVEYENLTTATK